MSSDAEVRLTEAPPETESSDDEQVVVAALGRSRSLPDRPVALFFARVATVAAILLAWEGLTASGFLDAFFFSRPSRIWDSLVGLIGTPTFWTHLRVTMTEAAIGLVIGSSAGILFGIVFARSRLLYALFDPILTALYTLPRVALAPLFILWFGLGMNAKIALVISVVYFIMLLNTYAGMTNVDPELVDTLRLMDAPRHLMYRRLYIPATVPYLVAALRLSLSFSIAAAIVGEMLVSQFGLGQLLRQRSDLLDTAGTMAVLTVIAAVAMVLHGAIKTIELFLNRWRPQPDQDAAPQVTGL